MISTTFLIRGIVVIALFTTGEFKYLLTTYKDSESWLPLFSVFFTVAVDFIPTLYQGFAIQWLINETKAQAIVAQ
jgi:hypothetical protein